MNVSDASVDFLSSLLERRAGHPLSRERRYRIESSLSPLLRSRRIDSIDTLVDRLRSSGSTELETEVVEALLNNETYFFRDRQPFELIERVIRERLMKARPVHRLSIWCAGVSTGQEAYSLAMMLDDLPELSHGWRVDILGTDVSAAVIARAKSGLYTQFEIQRGLPSRQMIRYFQKSGSDWQITPQMRSRIEFQCQDITRDPAIARPPHDIILCRNLLLYLSPDTRRAVFERLFNALSPDGVLVLGAAETILGQTDRFEPDQEYRGLFRPKAAARDVMAAGKAGHQLVSG